MDIDERLEFLRQSTESLHAASQELHATVARQAEENTRLAREAREQTRRLHRAILKAMQAYLTEMGEDGDGV